MSDAFDATDALRRAEHKLAWLIDWTREQAAEMMSEAVHRFDLGLTRTAQHCVEQSDIYANHAKHLQAVWALVCDAQHQNDETLSGGLFSFVHSVFGAEGVEKLRHKMKQAKENR